MFNAIRRSLTARAMNRHWILWRRAIAADQPGTAMLHMNAWVSAHVRLQRLTP
jgi:hypothetical protein